MTRVTHAMDRQQHSRGPKESSGSQAVEEISPERSQEREGFVSLYPCYLWSTCCRMGGVGRRRGVQL